MFQRPITLLILIATTACITLGLAVFFATRGGPGTGQQFTEFPSGTPAASSTRQTTQQYSYIEFSPPLGGQTVFFRDPRELMTTTELGRGIYQLTTLDPQARPDFGVVFNEADGSFAVGLETEPLAQARLKAEEYLRSTLGLSNEELCTLTVYVGTAARVNTFYAGKNLGLSFCPGAIVLE